MNLPASMGRCAQFQSLKDLETGRFVHSGHRGMLNPGAANVDLRSTSGHIRKIFTIVPANASAPRPPFPLPPPPHVAHPARRTRAHHHTLTTARHGPSPTLRPSRTADTRPPSHPDDPARQPSPHTASAHPRPRLRAGHRHHHRRPPRPAPSRCRRACDTQLRDGAAYQHHRPVRQRNAWTAPAHQPGGPEGYRDGRRGRRHGRLVQLDGGSAA
ncbi:hypothetical protein PLICRDRAFT_179017 [Plicaturopsis crispa FD-325 SS-3]|uniref:Uncharacterized protein n=1 Tax=Plicaturopsis crispa FD-325 SS-3 TaxID=944288 RepID=A0A0C9TAG3_PLICR|nr:hypothetical protein PLICRDRAFT_179017 [Plicaturopsis crispa FD-325 SS-3]